MICKSCGAEVAQHATHCSRCGVTLDLPPKTRISLTAVLALLVASFGFLIALLADLLLAPGWPHSDVSPLWFHCVLIAAVAVILATIAGDRIRKSGRLRGKALINAALVLAGLTVVLVVIWDGVRVFYLHHYGGGAFEGRAMQTIRQVNFAELTHFSNFPGSGFTCDMRELRRDDPFLHPSLEGGLYDGYVFSLSNCGAKPSTTYRITARPQLRGQTGVRTFCSNQEGQIRYSYDPLPENCISAGKPVE